MPISNRKFVCGKADILSLFGVGFLTLSLITIVGITSNPLKTQLIGAYAKGKEKVKETGSAFQNYVDSKIRQRERTGACVGKYCVAEDVIKNQASQGNNSNAAPSAQTAAEQDIIDTYNKAVGGDTAALDTLKKNNASLAKQAEAQKVQNDAAAAAAAQKTCEDGGGTWNANGTCGNGAVNQPASNPINTPFSAPNIAECKDAAGSTYDFNYSGGKCTLTQKPAPQSAPASQPAPAQPTTTNNSLLNIATGNTSNQTDVNQVRNQCNSDKASGRLPSTNLQSLDCGLAFDLQQYALGKLQAAAPTTYQQAQQTNTTNLQQMGDCIRGGGTWLNNNTCQSKQVVASQPMTTIAVTPQQGLSIKMQTGGICLFSSDCESGNCSAGTCKASAPIIKYPQITMTQLNACTGSGGQIDLSTGKCAYSPAAQQNLNKLKSQCQSTQGCYWDAYTNQPINTGVPGIIDTLTFGQFSNAIGDITRLNQQYNSSYGTSNYKPVITPGGFNDTSANLQLAGTLAKTVAASAPVPIVGGATLAFGGELVVSTVTGAAAAGVPVSTYVAAQAGALTTTAIASSPLWLQQTIQTVSPYVAPVLTVGTTAPFAVNQTIQCGFAGSKFDSPGCASANEQAFYAAAGLQQMQDIEIALNSQKVSQSLPEVLANAKNSVTNRLFSDVAYDAAVNDIVTGAAANPAKYGLAVTPTTADLTPTKINMPTSVSDALSSAKTKASNLVNNLADQAVQSDLIGGNITQDVATGITSGLKGEPTLNQKLSTTLQDATNKAVNNFPIVSNEVQLEADQAMARNLAAAKPAAEIPTTPLVESPQPSWLARIQNRISQTSDDLGTNIKTLATDAQESLGGLLRKLSPPPTAPIAKQGAEPILSSVDQNLVESLKTDKTIRQLIETENYTEAKNLVVDSLTKNLPPSLDSKSPQIQAEIENAAREIANAQTIGGRVTAVENTISNSGYESFGTLVDKPTPPNVPVQREINVLGHTQVYPGGVIKPATVSFTPDEVKRIGDNSLAIAQRMQLPQSGNIDDVSQIIGSLNKSLADPGTQLGKDQRDLINILYSINSYPEGSFPDILNNFIKNGGKASDLPQLYADLLSENAGRYKSFQAFWDPVFKTYNDMLPDINAQLPEGVKPIKPIDPESTYWISGTEKNLSGKNCFTGYCSINSPIQDGERNYISMNVNLGLSDDVVAREKVMLTYPSGFTTESSISVPKVGDVASAGRNDALHVMLHESIHANTLDTIGIYRALPDDSIVTKTLEELTERTTIKIEDKLVQQFPEIYGAANRFTAYPTERTIGTGISNALGISDDDVMAYALRQDPIGYIKHLDDVYGKLDGNGYRNFVDSLYDNLKIGPAQKQFLLGNKPPSVMDVRLMVDDWAQNIKFFDRPISGYQGLLNLQKAGYTTYPEEAVGSADAFSRYIESSKNLLSQEGYIPKSFYSQTAEGQYILNYQRPPIPENTTTKPNLINQIRDFLFPPQSEKGGGITINVQPNGNPPTKDNFITQAWNKTKSYFSDSWTNLRENFGGLFAKPPPPATVEIVAKQNPFVEEDMFPTNIEPSKPAQRIETQTYTDLTNSLAQSKRPVLQDNLGSQITIEAKINQGGYGSIYYANYRGEGVVAKISTYTDGEPLIASEYGYIQTIRNAIQDAGRPDLLPRIVEAKAPILAKDGSIIGYVMNDIPGPTLNDYIIGGSQALSAKDIKDFKDIARILDDAGLPFGDIFPTNIAKDLNGNWVLFDPVAPNALESGHVIARGVTTNGNPLPDYFKNVGDNIFISPQTGGFIYQVPTGNVDALDTMIRTFDIQPLQAQLRPQPPAPFGPGIEEIQKSDLFQAIKNFLTPATSPTSEVAPAQLVFDKAFQYVLENRRPILFTSLGIGGGYTIAQNFGIIRTGIQNLWQSLPFNKQQSPLTTSPQNQFPETANFSSDNSSSNKTNPEKTLPIPYKGYIAPEKMSAAQFQDIAGLAQVFNEVEAERGIPEMNDYAAKKAFIEAVIEKLKASGNPQFQTLASDPNFLSYFAGDRVQGSELFGFYQQNIDKHQLLNCNQWAIGVSRLLPELHIVADQYAFQNGGAFSLADPKPVNAADTNCYSDMKTAETKCSGNLQYNIGGNVSAFRFTDYGSINKGDSFAYGQHFGVILDKYFIDGKYWFLVTEANSPKGNLEGQPQTYLVSQDDFSSRVNDLSQTYFLRLNKYNPGITQPDQPDQGVLDAIKNYSAQTISVPVTPNQNPQSVAPTGTRISSSTPATTKNSDPNAKYANLNGHEWLYYNQLDYSDPTKYRVPDPYRGKVLTWANGSCLLMVSAMATGMSPDNYYTAYKAQGYDLYADKQNKFTVYSKTEWHVATMESLGYDVHQINGNNTSLDDIKAQIKNYTDQGIPVLIGSSIPEYVKGKMTPIPHAVEAIGIDDKGNIIVNDPVWGPERHLSDRDLHPSSDGFEVYAIIPPGQ